MTAPLGIRYASIPCGQVAFGVAGAGPGYLMMPGHVCFSDFRNAPWVEHIFLEITSTHTFVTYDHVGGGLSSRDSLDYSLEALSTELEAVVEASGCERVSIFTCGTDTPAAIRYAATHTERVSALTISNGWPRGSDRVRTDQSKTLLDAMMADWDITARAISRMWMNWSVTDADRVNEFVRNATDLPTYREYTEAMWSHDASPYVEKVTAPTLVLYTLNPYMPVDVSQEMVARIPDARLQIVEVASTLQELFDASRTFIATLNRPDSGTPVAQACGALSSRESAVLKMLAEGSSNAAIAAHLTLSVRTVERHVRNIYNKIGVHNRAAATRWAIDNGMA